MSYIWQSKNWPDLRWDSDELLPLTSRARLAQGKLLAKMENLGLTVNQEARANILTEEAIRTAEIEGEKLKRDSVRSSVARHLKLPSAGLGPVDRSVDGLVEVILDATQNYRKSLTAARLKRWQAALFPAGYSGLRRVQVGGWRGTSPAMQVVSGAAGREKIHYEAPPGRDVHREMKRFLVWWTASQQNQDGLLRAGLAHFYFVTIHPFEDGNGRIARVITDMALAQDEKLPMRSYSLSAQIMEDRKNYYSVLERTQKQQGNVTGWLKWFLGCYTRAVEKAEQLMADVLAKSEYWSRHQQAEISPRQRKVLNRLLNAGPGGFAGGLTTRKYVSMAKVSRATAFREISDLLGKGLLCQNSPKGRSASYDIDWGQ